MPELHARRCHVTGKVQGVFFRASTRQKALELGCRGYAKNLPDGRVEVLAIGEPQAVASLIEWLWIGPPTARVTAVNVETLELDALAQIPNGFATA
jgi:acylphosphatase